MRQAVAETNGQFRALAVGQKQKHRGENQDEQGDPAAPDQIEEKIVFLPGFGQFGQPGTECVYQCIDACPKRKRIARRRQQALLELRQQIFNE